MDGYIDNWDAYMVARAFGSSQGSSLYNPYADFNSDGFVDAFDALICAHNLGRDIWHVLGVPKLIRDYMVVGPFPLPSGNSTIINFRWNTTSVAKGKYTISAYVWPVPGDTDMTDDTFTNGMVYVGIPGDLNADGIVDVFDAVILAGAAGSRPGSSNWNPNADINSDGIVDIFDAVILSGHT